MKNNVFVDLPKYINTSNGTKCLIDLSTKLESKNIKIIKLFRDNKILSKLKKKFNLEFSNNNCQKLTKKAQKGDWFLACDTTPSLLLNKARKHGVKILWWQLAPYQFLGSNQIPKVGDFNLPFSSYTDPKSDTYYYYQPDVDPEWKKALNKKKFNPQRKNLKICLYNGKGRLCTINNKLREYLSNYQIEAITRINPKQKSEYFNMLLNCDGLISFDEMSQTNLEAASLGIPVYVANPLFPEKCIRKFNIKELEKRVTSRPEIFISMLEKESFISNPFDVNYLKSFNSNTIKKFVDIFNGDIDLKPLNKNEIGLLKKYSKSLRLKQVIYPYVNSGQSPSSLLIKPFIKNIINKNKYKNIQLWITVFDSVGHFLYKLGLIRICEILILKIKNFLEK